MEISKEVDLDGNKYLITHPDPEEAHNIGVEIIKIIGEPYAALVSKAAEDPMAAVSEATKILMVKIDAKQSFSIIKRVLRHVEWQGPSEGPVKKSNITDAVLKIHFQGRNGAMMKLAVEAIKFQLSDFFSAVTDGIAILKR